ncbi:MAG: hypothetical protein KC502_02745 [Myxococcales bacterium]|nr:hypothetical protein [Myxococcales bacterium]
MGKVELFAAMVVLPMLAMGCGGDDPKPSPVTSLCTGTEQKCDGNALLTCADEGKAWTVGWCGESKTCTSSAGNPGCAGVKCERASRSCSGQKVVQCPDDGLEEAAPVETCTSKQHCMAGQCVTTACTAGTKLCGWKTVLSCDGGSWNSVKCKSSERCDPETTACVARTCKPTEAQCAGEKTRAVCNNDGSAWVETACKAAHVCTDGVCHPKLAGAKTPVDGGTITDASGASDAGFIDAGKKDIQLEAFDKLTVTRSDTPTPGPNATVIDFEFVAAGFSSVTKMVQITGDKGLNKLEIQIAPTEEFTTGSFTALEAQAEDSAILMNDGGNDQDKVQWQFQAVDYTLQLTAFDDVGGRIKGSFSAKMGDALNKGKFIYLQGTFDIKRTN